MISSSNNILLVILIVAKGVLACVNNVEPVCSGVTGDDVFYDASGNICYVMVTSEVQTWSSAMSRCAQYASSKGLTGHLAWFTSQSQFDAVKAGLPNAVDDAWIGLNKKHAKATRAELYWYSNETTASLPATWGPGTLGYAQTDGTKTCMRAKNWPSAGSFVNMRCSNALPFLCQLGCGSSHTPAYQPTSCTDHCEAVNGLVRGESCFIMEPLTRSFDSADETCKALGGDGVPGTTGRLAHVPDLAAFNTMKADFNTPDQYWVGLKDTVGSNVFGDYKWISGVCPLEDSQLSTDLSSYVEFSSDTQRCARLHVSANAIRDIRCDTSYAFLCELKVCDATMCVATTTAPAITTTTTEPTTTTTEMITTTTISETTTSTTLGPTTTTTESITVTTTAPITTTTLESTTTTVITTTPDTTTITTPELTTTSLTTTTTPDTTAATASKSSTTTVTTTPPDTTMPKSTTITATTTTPDTTPATMPESTTTTVTTMTLDTPTTTTPKSTTTIENTTTFDATTAESITTTVTTTTPESNTTTAPESATTTVTTIIPDTTTTTPVTTATTVTTITPDIRTGTAPESTATTVPTTTSAITTLTTQELTMTPTSESATAAPTTPEPTTTTRPDTAMPTITTVPDTMTTTRQGTMTTTLLEPASSTRFDSTGPTTALELATTTVTTVTPDIATMTTTSPTNPGATTSTMLEPISSTPVASTTTTSEQLSTATTTFESSRSARCPVLLVENGHLENMNSFNDHTATKSLVCQSGYVPQGSPTVCNNGQWSTIPSCKSTENWRCPLGKPSIYTGPACYWLSSSGSTWNDAFLTCAAEGGLFAPISSSDLWKERLLEFIQTSGIAIFWINVKYKSDFDPKLYDQSGSALMSSPYLPYQSTLSIKLAGCKTIYVTGKQLVPVSCTLTLKSLCYRPTAYAQFQFIKNQVLVAGGNQTKLGETTTSSVRDCVRNCKRDMNCLATNYNRGSEICELYSQKPSDGMSSAIQPHDGSIVGVRMY